MKPNCIDCFYWDGCSNLGDSDGRFGECLFLPPKVCVIPNEFNSSAKVKSIHPKTFQTDFCSKFKLKETIKKEK